MMGLTPKQRELLLFIADFILNRGYSPSYAEMTVALGLASKSGFNRLLEALEDRGAIRRLHGRVRAIEVLSIPPAEPLRRPPAVSTAPDGAPLYFVAVCP